MAGIGTGASRFEFLELPVICSQHKNISQVMHHLYVFQKWHLIVNQLIFMISKSLGFRRFIQAAQASYKVF